MHARFVVTLNESVRRNVGILSWTPSLIGSKHDQKLKKYKSKMAEIRAYWFRISIDPLNNFSNLTKIQVWSIMINKYKVQSVINIPGFANSWYFQNLGLPDFRIFWSPKMTSTCLKQPMDHRGVMELDSKGAEAGIRKSR